MDVTGSYWDVVRANGVVHWYRVLLGCYMVLLGCYRVLLGCYRGLLGCERCCEIGRNRFNNGESLTRRKLRDRTEKPGGSCCWHDDAPT